MGRLSGALTHATVAARYDTLVTAADDGEALDLSTVETVDSAAVALLLAMRRRRGQPLQLAGTPEPLQKLIDCFGAETLLSQSRP